MKFNGGTCENIYGELLDYEIIQHENNLITECRLERRIVHLQKWLGSTIILTYLAALIGVHKNDSSLLLFLSIILLIGVIIKAYLKVKRECVIVGDQMGLQLTTTYVIGRQTTIFISSNRIKDILINEGFLSQRLIYYLTLMINANGDRSMLPLFIKLLPRLSLLKLFYRHLHTVIHKYRHEDQQRRQQLLTIVDRGSSEQLFSFLQQYHRRPFRNLVEVMAYDGVIDDQIDFIDCTATRYNVTPLIIAAGKGSYEKTKILLVHGANPNKQCSTGLAGADPTLEDRNQRIPLDEAVMANKPEIVGALLSHDRTLVQRAHRAGMIAARFGHDKCLQILLDFGMDPNITDRTRTTPLHVAVRSLKLSAARILVSHGADPNIANNRGETPLSIAEYLQPDQKQSFSNVLLHTPRAEPSDFHRYTSGTIQANVIPYVHPLLRSHPNWTLDSEEFRSQTDANSSVQNLLDTSSGSYWCCTQNKGAWVIFDLKHQYNISGMRIIGSDNQSTPKSGRIDVSNAFNGPWLKVKDFSCSLSQGNKNDIFFTPLKTRFIRVFITDNYGGDDIRIQGIGFYGLDMRLVELLREYGLERSLHTLLANGINDLETLDEKRDEILNSSDRYLDVNDHFQFIRLTESLRSPKLTFLEWFNPPQSTVIAGEKLQTFSAAGDEAVTDRVKLEEKPENSPQVRTVLMRDLEPIQGRSLVDFPDYVIRDPGRYKVRVISVDSPNIQTQWHDIVVGKFICSSR
ncbi:unnamed protein product [Rotaria sp. Silwood2]|nr:unnamed protein product [Rotaria sp. Silwood2]